MIGALSDEARIGDFKYLLVSAPVILLTAIETTAMLVSAWRPESVVRKAVLDLTATTGLNIDVFVVFPAGVFFGWIGLFLFDRSKRGQAVVLLIGSVLFVAGLRYRGVWAEEVAWLTFAPWLIGGLAVGVVSGAVLSVVPGLFDDRRAGEFPGAVAALLVTAVLVTTLGFYDLHIRGRTALSEAALHACSSVLFVGLLGVFVRYVDRSDVVVVSPEGQRRAETELLCGLYDVVDKRYSDSKVRGDVELNEARTKLRERGVVDPPAGQTEFGFKPSGWFSRWVSIRADNYDIRNQYDTQVGQMCESLSPPSGALDAFLDLFARSFPTVGSDSEFLDRVQSAETVLLVVPLGNSPVDTAFEEWDFDAHDSPTYLEKYARLCTAAADGRTDVVLVATDAHVAARGYEKERNVGVTLDPAHRSYRNFRRSVSQSLARLLEDSDTDTGRGLDASGGRASTEPSHTRTEDGDTDEPQIQCCELVPVALAADTAEDDAENSRSMPRETSRAGEQARSTRRALLENAHTVLDELLT